MRVVTETFLRSQTETYPNATSWITAFIATARRANWKSIVDVRQQYPSADAVEVGSERTVYVFNVAGNNYRLIAAIHFKTGIIYALRFLTHAEYSKNSWKNDL